MTKQLVDIDRAVLTATQAGLPLVPRPFAEVGAVLGLSEAAVLESFERMQAANVLRRIAAVPNHYKLGYIANAMTVWDIADADVDSAGADVGALSSVSHCYRRPRHLPLWPYNLFAMVHGRSRSEVETYVTEIATLLGTRSQGHDILYSTRILKKTGLRLPAKEPA